MMSLSSDHLLACEIRKLHKYASDLRRDLLRLRSADNDLHQLLRIKKSPALLLADKNYLAAIDAFLMRVLYVRTLLALRDSLRFCKPELIGARVHRLVESLDSVTLRLNEDAECMHPLLTSILHEELEEFNRNHEMDSENLFQSATRVALLFEALKFSGRSDRKAFFDLGPVLLSKSPEWKLILKNYALWALSCGLDPSPGNSAGRLPLRFAEDTLMEISIFFSRDLSVWLWPLADAWMDDPVIPGWTLAVRRSNLAIFPDAGDHAFSLDYIVYYLRSIKHVANCMEYILKNVPLRHDGGKTKLVLVCNEWRRGTLDIFQEQLRVKRIWPIVHLP